MKTKSIFQGTMAVNAFPRPGLSLVVTVCLLIFSIATVTQTNAQSGTTDLYKLKGVVLASKDNAPLAGVNIYLKGTSIGTFSDAEGKFTFPRNLATGEVLVFSFVGLLKQELIVSTNLPESVEVRLEEDPINILGEVCVERAETRKQKRKSLEN
ncbi:MAG: carboxypeptidase-like regulatory domain-containing protein [Cyclobacteriaceae bacterium]|nr:carboxypeptidase-like regulatory domain-containing protein [Cyclobacteriaceae bacterium]